MFHHSSLNICYSLYVFVTYSSKTMAALLLQAFNHIWLNETPTLPYRKSVLAHILRVCFRSKFMAATGHHFMNKFQRKSFLPNMEEKLVQQQYTGVRQIMIFFLISEKFETIMRTGTAFQKNNSQFKYQSVTAGYS